MPIEYEANPERFQGTGTVFIAWDPDEEAYIGYWDSLPDSPPAPIEPMPPSVSLEEAVAWGRKRTARVLIRPASHPGEYFWAGAGDPGGEDAELPVWRESGDIS